MGDAVDARWWSSADESPARHHWYPGKVTAVDAEAATVTILYVDGVTQAGVPLSDVKLRRVAAASASHDVQLLSQLERCARISPNLPSSH